MNWEGKKACEAGTRRHTRYPGGCSNLHGNADFKNTTD